MHAGRRSGSSLYSSALLAALASCLLVPSGARADETAGGWRNTVVIYGMGAAIDGTAQIGSVTVPVEVDQFTLMGTAGRRLTQQGPLVGVTFSF